MVLYRPAIWMKITIFSELVAMSSGTPHSVFLWYSPKQYIFCCLLIETWHWWLTMLLKLSVFVFGTQLICLWLYMLNIFAFLEFCKENTPQSITPQLSHHTNMHIQQITFETPGNNKLWPTQFSESNRNLSFKPLIYWISYEISSVKCSILVFLFCLY